MYSISAVKNIISELRDKSPQNTSKKSYVYDHTCHIHVKPRPLGSRPQRNQTHTPTRTHDTDNTDNTDTDRNTQTDGHSAQKIHGQDMDD